MNTQSDGIVIYFAYGRDEIFVQTLFSILTLLYVFEREGNSQKTEFRVAVYTDNPSRFSALPVETVAIDQERLKEWLGGSDYIHRRKTCVIIDALERFECKTIFVDSDTWFSAHPSRIFSRIGPGRAVFHVCEGFVASTGTPFDTALAKQLERVPLFLRSGEQVAFNKRSRMWNTGVVGVDPADREAMLDALDLSDEIWRTADPAGAYGKKIHHAEQFATGYAFRNARLSEAVDCVYHYWPVASKCAFDAALPRLVELGLAEPRGETLARIYAERYREFGFLSLIDAAKMEIRRVALALGIPVKGVRRSVL